MEVTKRYSVIFADPPWSYQNFSSKKNGAAISHYDTMTVDDICAIPVADWSAKDAILLLWGCWPKATEAFKVMESWGFDYVTGFPWVKTTPSSGEIRRGIGFWVQGASEFVLVGRKGNAKRKSKENPVIGLLTGDPATFYAPIRGHSQKPEELQTWVERTMQGPYLELFATRERANWDCWGLSTGYRLSSEGVEKLVTPIAHKEN